MKKFRMYVLAVQIERKWRKIGKNRKRMETLIKQKEPYTSPRLCRLDAQTAKLGFSAQELEKQFRELQRAG